MKFDKNIYRNSMFWKLEEKALDTGQRVRKIIKEKPGFGQTLYEVNRTFAGMSCWFLLWPMQDREI